MSAVVKMFKPLLDYLKEKPRLYSASTAPFWNDEHISKGMLEAHLNLEVESASRKYDDITRSVDWIAKTFYTKEKNLLLDLGCGPGLYTELFCKAGFNVTGVDLSARSIAYATEHARTNNLPITYLCKDYLGLDYENAFDVITLIYCDFGVLSPEDRRSLLHKMRKAMKPNGRLILDAFTPCAFANFLEHRTIQYADQGYWHTKPYMCIQSNYTYPESRNYLEQYIVVTQDNCACYNIWNQAFDTQSLTQELHDAGFKDIDFYDDVTGKALTGTCDTICVVAK